MFTLLRYFSLTSLVLIVLMALSLGALCRHIAIANLLQMGERNNVALAGALANALQAQFTPLLQAEAAGRRVTEAVDGAHAVASYAAQPFDCILRDALQRAAHAPGPLKDPAHA